MNARQILEDVRAEERQRAELSGYKRLSKAEEAPFRERKVARYTEAIDLDPSFGDAYAERGSELYFLGRRAEAKADMRKAVALGVSDPELYGTMAMPFEGEEQRAILRTGIGLIDRSSAETGWFYDHLYSMVVRSYWYEGNFVENARLLEEWVPQLDQTEHMYRIALGELGMAYSALGKHAEAETAYRRRLAATPPAERPHVADMVVRTLMHRDQYGEALRVLEELADRLSADTRAMFAAALTVLQDPGSAVARDASAAALAAAEDWGRRPGPLGDSTSYYSFLLGLVYRGVGKNREAAEILTRFADEAAANKREWGVTMRWEIAKARELATTR
jgi:tetratricopeptide (TPR) repeat protein